MLKCMIYTFSHSQVHLLVSLVYRSGVRHTNLLLRVPVFRIFSINWFTYGFPVRNYKLDAFSLYTYVFTNNPVNRT